MAGGLGAGAASRGPWPSTIPANVWVSSFNPCVMFGLGVPVLDRFPILRLYEMQTEDGSRQEGGLESFISRGGLEGADFRLAWFSLADSRQFDKAEFYTSGLSPCYNHIDKFGLLILEIETVVLKSRNNLTFSHGCMQRG